MTALTTFTCSICGQTSQDICVYCTKDTCPNHMCQRCRRCSDCCVCETPVIRGVDEEVELPQEVAGIPSEEPDEIDELEEDEELDEDEECGDDIDDEDDEEDQLEDEDELEDTDEVKSPSPAD